MPTDFPDEATEYSFLSLYNQLLEMGEIILTIQTEDEDSLRKGLAATKYRQQKKLKDAGLEPEQTTLEFQILPQQRPGLLEVQIRLERKASIKVHAVRLPDNEL